MILLVEDEPFILMDLQCAVEDTGQVPVSASNVRTALDHIARQPIDVAILDFSLGPHENCVPVAKALSNRGIPFVLHTGDADQLDETLRKLTSTVIPKPAPANQVVERALRAAG